MKILSRIIFVVALLTFIGSAGYLIKHYVDGAKEENDFVKLKVDGGHDLKALHQKNPHTVGWISIGGTNIDYPVMQTKDEDGQYYLRRNFNKERSEAGTPFVDFNSDMKKPSANWIIYGHHMKNGTMFRDLMNYEKKEFYDKNKIIKFETLQGEGQYEIVAAFRTEVKEVGSKEFQYYQYPNITDRGRFKEYVQGIKRLAAYDTGVTPVYGDQLITLSTCSEDNYSNGRFVVVARKI